MKIIKISGKATEVAKILKKLALRKLTLKDLIV